MKRIWIAIAGALVLAAMPALAGETKLGKPVTVASPTPIRELLASPDKYLGTDVAVEGEIVDVCQNQGCWMNLKDATSPEAMRIKVNDGEIVFPKDGKGKKALAQGKFEKIVLTKEQYIEQLRHEAEESGKKVDTSKVTEGKTTYRIKGSGAVVR
jgi:hypothetical protein